MFSLVYIPFDDLSLFSLQPCLFGSSGKQVICFLNITLGCLYFLDNSQFLICGLQMFFLPDSVSYLISLICWLSPGFVESHGVIM